MFTFKDSFTLAKIYRIVIGKTLLALPLWALQQQIEIIDVMQKGANATSATTVAVIDDFVIAKTA